MENLAKALQNLVSLVNDRSVNPQVVFNAVKAVVNEAENSNEQARNEALGQLTDLLATVDLGRAAFIIMAVGALVEQDGDPYIALSAVLTRFNEALDEAAAFANACKARAAQDTAATPDEQVELDDFYIEKYGAEIAAQLPQAAQGWGVLELIGVPVVALLSRSAEGRKTARADAKLVANLQNFPAQHAMIDYVISVLEVLDDEEIVVIDPVLEKGYRVKISGIGDNFQLQTLLTDALVGNPEKGWLPGDRPDPRIVAAARDQRVSPEAPTATGIFNLISWQGLQFNGALDKGPSADANWIWGEGIPADIPDFDGTRVILLEPAPYLRSWNADRRFDAMPGELHVTEKMKPEDVRDWLKRIATANH